MSGHRHTATRAARLQLAGRIELIGHAVELLRNKEKALERERVRLEGYASRAEQRWRSAYEESAAWLVRARLLGGSDELAALVRTGPSPATVTTDWQVSMGVTYPGGVECDPGPRPRLGSTAALPPTVDAFREALDAAAQHAATSAAVRSLDIELADTRRRRRAIGDRLLPRLHTELHGLDLHLDEQDREQAMRVHLAVSRSERDRP